MKTVVFVDGENFQKKVRQVFRQNRLVWDSHRFARLDLRGLLQEALPEADIDSLKYYVARLHVYPETKQKSEELVALQRALKTNLEKQKVEFVMSGSVRMFALETKELLFKEKGVDVRLAVDAISLAADKKMRTAIICSSDSDMQPVVKELRRRKVHVIYVGFQIQPNKGLIFTCDETILLRKAELQKFMPKHPPQKLKIRRFDDD
jgi:uncharacterized LabA/DUF88 family protein